MSYLVHTHKRGDTFDMSGYSELTNGDAPDLTGWTGASEVRDDDGLLIEALTFSWLDSSLGLCRVKSIDDTSAWPLGRLFFDIQLTTATGEIQSTPTVTLLVVGDITQ